MAADPVRKTLGPEIKRHRGRGAGGADFCLWVIPGLLIPLGFFSFGLYLAFVDYAQTGFSSAGRPWILLAGVSLLPFTILTFRRFRMAGKAVAVHRNGLHLIGIAGRSSRLRWENIRSVTTSGTRYHLAGKPVSDQYSLAITIAGGRTVRIPDRIEHLDELAETIHKHIEPLVQPEIFQRLDQGESVPFGPVAVTRSGLAVGKRRLSWPEMDRLGIADGSLVIESAGKRIALPVGEVPNTALLLEIAARYGSGDRKP